MGENGKLALAGRNWACSAPCTGEDCRIAVRCGQRGVAELKWGIVSSTLLCNCNRGSSNNNHLLGPLLFWPGGVGWGGGGAGYSELCHAFLGLVRFRRPP